MLEVVVSTDGDKAVFRLPEGSTNEQAADAVVSFCSTHVGGDDLEQCTKALSQVSHWVHYRLFVHIDSFWCTQIGSLISKCAFMIL